jgi:hypothetical protein
LTSYPAVQVGHSPQRTVARCHSDWTVPLSPRVRPPGQRESQPPWTTQGKHAVLLPYPPPCSAQGFGYGCRRGTRMPNHIPPRGFRPPRPPRIEPPPTARHPQNHPFTNRHRGSIWGRCRDDVFCIGHDYWLGWSVPLLSGLGTHTAEHVHWERERRSLEK